MRASTARGIETIFWLGVWGIGIWWFVNNILPSITQALKQGIKTTPTPAPAPAPTSPSTPLPAPDLGTSFGDLGNMVQSLWNVFSGLGKQGLLQNEDVKKTVDNAANAAVEKAAAANAAYLGSKQPWTGLTSYPETEYNPEAWKKYYEARHEANLRNISRKW